MALLILQARHYYAALVGLKSVKPCTKTCTVRGGSLVLQAQESEVEAPVREVWKVAVSEEHGCAQQRSCGVGDVLASNLHAAKSCQLRNAQVCRAQQPSLCKAGRTCLYVSHSLPSIQTLGQSQSVMDKICSTAYVSSGQTYVIIGPFFAEALPLLRCMQKKMFMMSSHRKRRIHLGRHAWRPAQRPPRGCPHWPLA